MIVASGRTTPGIARAAQLDPGVKVLPHCHMGVNRGLSIAYSLLLDVGVDPIEAFT